MFNGCGVNTIHSYLQMFSTLIQVLINDVFEINSFTFTTLLSVVFIPCYDWTNPSRGCTSNLPLIILTLIGGWMILRSVFLNSSYLYNVIDASISLLGLS